MARNEQSENTRRHFFSSNRKIREIRKIISIEIKIAGKKITMTLHNCSFLPVTLLNRNGTRTPTRTRAVHSKRPRGYTCTVDTSGSHQISSSFVTRTNGCIFSTARPSRHIVLSHTCAHACTHNAEYSLLHKSNPTQSAHWLLHSASKRLTRGYNRAPTALHDKGAAQKP